MPSTGWGLGLLCTVLRRADGSCIHNVLAFLSLCITVVLQGWINGLEKYAGTNDPSSSLMP